MQAHSTDQDPPSVSGAAQALRLLTQDRHRAVETLPIFRRLMQPDVTQADYVAVLRVQYRFYAAVEPALATSDGLGLPYQARLPLLARDLVALACPLPEIAELPLAIPSKAAACGCRYVIEGSVLGGRIITRHLREHLGEAVASALAFYTLDGKPQVSWPKLQQALSEQLDSQQDIRAAVEYANRVFKLLEEAAESCIANEMK